MGPRCDDCDVDVDVVLVPDAMAAASARTRARVVIVIDQIRASTTITTLLDLGCSRLLLEGSVAGARRLARDTGSLLVGERHARRPPGFDFDNSPSALSRADLRGRSVVLSTTNGTAVLRRFRRSPRVLVGCLRNARACAMTAIGLVGDDHDLIRIVCAGREGRFNMEDAIAAGVIAGHILDGARALGREPSVTDGAEAAVRLRASYPDLLAALELSDGGRVLHEIGQEEDIAFCAEEDASSTVPILRDGEPMEIRAFAG
jgi:2-phosphosulfolactate phosphatase